MTLKGFAHIYHDNIDTDIIIPARYLNTFDPNTLASHCMEPVDPEFSKKVKAGDFIIAGKNFGCGSSREHAPIAIKASGVSCVIAKSFARIFYRNSINIGLPIIEHSDIYDDAGAGDVFTADLENGTVVNLSKNKTYTVAPYPKEIQQIITRGGLLKQ